LYQRIKPDDVLNTGDRAIPRTHKEVSVPQHQPQCVDPRRTDQIQLEADGVHIHLSEKAITGKNTLWERSARVPLIISGPGFAAGEICQRPVELLDLYPTLVDAAGLEPRGGLEGLSLVPLLENPEAPRTVPAITTQGEGNHSIRSERYRYIRYGDGSEELYDMAQDPNEWDNLADEPEYAAVLAQHRQWLPKTNAEPVPGSKTRLLEKRDDGWYWQLEKIEGPVLMGDPSLIRR